MRGWGLRGLGGACALMFAATPAGAAQQGATARAAPQSLEAVAVRTTTPPAIDGVLDDAVWAGIEPITDFRQRDPVDGAPGSERTELRIAYDENALYFGLTLYDSEPHLIRRSILQRGGRIDKDDRVVIALDTYLDRRNGYIFEIGALGTQDDALFSDESLVLDDWSWDGVYESETSVTDEGWILEVAIPFTTIRFADVAEPVMGIAVERTIRRKNENVIWPHIGQEYRSGISQVSQYGTLHGIRDVRRGRHLELKPFGIAGAQRRADVPGTERIDDVGLDLKYAVTSNVTVDATWNTDFAQVEADNVRINLTRFNLFFPEKREFFLERAGLFSFGAARETEVFFSRRIGIDSPIRGGGRVTGQVGPLSFGALSLRTEDVAGVGGAPGVQAAWNSVFRARADVLPRTTVGGIFTSLERSGDEHNRVAGVDAFARFWSSSSLFLWAARAWDRDVALFPSGQQPPPGGNPPDPGSSTAAQAELTLRNDRYHAELTRTHIGAGFAPALGFVPRPDQERWGGQLGVTPRFESSAWARQLSVFVRGNRITGNDGDKQSHFRRADAALRFQSGESVNLELSEQFERLTAPDRIQGRELPAGDYTYRFVSGRARTNDSRELSASADWSFGDFWSGTRTRLGAGTVWKSSEHLTLGLNVSHNDVSLPVPDGDFTTNLFTLDADAAVSRKLFASALVQWDDVSKTVRANVRVDWIHTPGSDLFVVIDTGYITGDLLDPMQERWVNRTGVVKLTYLRAF